MGNDGQRFPVVDRKRRHVVIVELLVLIIAENHDDIDLGAFEHISQRLDRFLTGFIAPAKFLRRQFRVYTFFCSLQQAVVIQPRIMLVLLPKNLPFTCPHAQLRAMRCPDS